LWNKLRGAYLERRQNFYRSSDHCEFGAYLLTSRDENENINSDGEKNRFCESRFRTFKLSTNLIPARTR
jgi:hypothetical protein